MDDDFQQLKAMQVAQQARDDQNLAELARVLAEQRAALLEEGVDELQLRLFEGMVAQWALLGGVERVSADQLRFLLEYERRHG